MTFDFVGTVEILVLNYVLRNICLKSDQMHGCTRLQTTDSDWKAAWRSQKDERDNPDKNQFTRIAHSVGILIYEPPGSRRTWEYLEQQ